MSDAAHAETDTKPGVAPEIEAKAREMGWRPKDEWEGDDSNWMDADKFVERQDKRRAIANEEFKAENESLKRQISALEKSQTEMQQTFKDFADWRTKAEERMYKKALGDLQAKQRSAVESGDTASFDEASKEIDTLLEDSRKAQEPAPEKKGGHENPDEIPAYKDWLRDNKWYNRDYELTDYANRIGPLIARNEKLAVDDPDYYERVTEEVRKKFPDKFENPNRQRQNGVESPSGGGGGKKGKSAADLPKEAKDAGARFVKQGLYKSLDDYAKDYFAQEE